MGRKIGKKKLLDILKGKNIADEKRIEQYQDLADCIRSDQVPASDVAKIFQDKMFYNWYKKKYLTFG